MSRAVRRQQKAAAPKESQPQRRGFGVRAPRQTRGARPAAPPRRRFRLGLPQWLEEIVAELKKVSWPSRDETMYLTMVVIVVSLSVGLVLGGIDIFFNWLIDRILLN